jgi:hypothetical protein
MILISAIIFYLISMAVVFFICYNGITKEYKRKLKILELRLKILRHEAGIK